jgi:hypothetical protein
MLSMRWMLIPRSEKRVGHEGGGDALRGGAAQDVLLGRPLALELGFDHLEVEVHAHALGLKQEVL